MTNTLSARIPSQLYAWLQYSFPYLNLAQVNLKFANPWTRSDGLTWGKTVTLRPTYEPRLHLLDEAAIELLCHELVHVEQFAQAGTFWLLHYLLHHREWEERARQKARELRALWVSQ